MPVSPCSEGLSPPPAPRASITESTMPAGLAAAAGGPRRRRRRRRAGRSRQTRRRALLPFSLPHPLPRRWRPAAASRLRRSGPVPPRLGASPMGALDAGVLSPSPFSTIFAALISRPPPPPPAGASAARDGGRTCARSCTGRWSPTGSARRRPACTPWSLAILSASEFQHCRTARRWRDLPRHMMRAQARPSAGGANTAIRCGRGWTGPSRLRPGWITRSLTPPDTSFSRGRPALNRCMREAPPAAGSRLERRGGATHVR